MVLIFKKAAKISLMLVLFVLCFTYFTLPSLNEYQAKQIIVTTSEEKVDEILAPAVTVCAQDPNLSVVDYDKIFLKYCANEKDIRRCMDDATINFSSNILNARKGYTPGGPKLMDPSLWIPEITLTASGKCYTLNTSQTVLEDFITGTIRIELNKNMIYNLFIHDINYFANNKNPYALPVNFLAINPGGGGNKV